MRKSIGIGHNHSHLSEEVGKVMGWAFEGSGDTARMACWIEAERWLWGMGERGRVVREKEVLSK